MENILLTNEEVLALDKIAVEGNKLITALHFASGYYGRGGSNGSPFTTEIDTTITLKELAGKPPMSIFGVQVCAIVNDVVYLAVNRKNGTVFSFGADGRYEDEYEIAYDTMECVSVAPVVNRE